MVAWELLGSMLSRVKASGLVKDLEATEQQKAIDAVDLLVARKRVTWRV